ncbi:MAG: hypothetical protein ACTSQJ_16600 [Promethearchaeota archaeon]
MGFKDQLKKTAKKYIAKKIGEGLSKVTGSKTLGKITEKVISGSSSKSTGSGSKILGSIAKKATSKITSKHKSGTKSNLISSFNSSSAHSRTSEEDLFNRLMRTPAKSGIHEKITFSEQSLEEEDLISKYQENIKSKMSKIEKTGDLEEFLQQGLGFHFRRIRGAWEQYKESTIGKDGLIHSAIVVLGQRFIDLFTNIPDFERSTAEPAKSSNQIKIPSIFSSLSSKDEKAKPLSAYSTKSDSIISVESETPEKVKNPEIIASIAPKKEIRSHLEALKKVGTELEKVSIKPMQYKKLEEAELKSVDVGALSPAAPLYDDFEAIHKLIRKKQYNLATQKLETLKKVAEKNKLPTAVAKAEDMITNMGAYNMISNLIEAGDKLLEKPIQAKEKFKKALGFAKIIEDSYYISKIKEKISLANKRIAFLKQKKIIEKEQEDKIKTLIKNNIKKLGKVETLMSIEEIRNYCNAKSEQIIMDTLIEMIQNKEIYAKLFQESKKVIFDKENNRLLIKI